MKIKIVISILVFLLVSGCAGSKMSVMQNTKAISHTVNQIAIAPGSGPFGDAIGVELFNMGFHIVDSNQAAAIIGRAGLKEFELYTPKGYETLRGEGIDAVLTAKSVDVNGTPESASVRVTDTANGNLLAGITWQNAWGGMRGSIADRTMRKNLSGAAQAIAKELSNRLRR